MTVFFLIKSLPAENSQLLALPEASPTKTKPGDPADSEIGF